MHARTHVQSKYLTPRPPQTSILLFVIFYSMSSWLLQQRKKKTRWLKSDLLPCKSYLGKGKAAAIASIRFQCINLHTVPYKFFFKSGRKCGFAPFSQRGSSITCVPDQVPSITQRNRPPLFLGSSLIQLGTGRLLWLFHLDA